ncbi:MAG: DUF1987 domain-containing protein [Bacteroidales bacterium]|nr:DUF1987 domain-containing protein [Bacteroidales bacterium]MBN2755915.1 DUF1987 domain-containing protein [Bacteroidales bacterium]
MEKIVISATQKTPIIHLDNGLIEIKGRSTPEDTDKVYLPVFSWIEKYLEEPNASTIVNFHFEYFNSSTTKALMRIINKLVGLSKSENFELIVNWYYFDEDILEHGQDFEELSGINFNFIESDYSNIDFETKNYN